MAHSAVHDNIACASKLMVWLCSVEITKNRGNCLVFKSVFSFIVD